MFSFRTPFWYAQNLYLFWHLKRAELRLIDLFWGVQWPIFFSRMAKNGQSLALEHHFKMFKDLRFIKTSEHGQSLATKHHFEMFRVYFFIHRYENGQSLTSEYHLKCPRNYFFVRFSEHLYEIFEEPLFSSDIWKRTEFSLKLPFEMSDNKFFIQTSENVCS